MNLALSSTNMVSVLGYGISLPARSGPLVTAGRRTLRHAGCTPRAAQVQACSARDCYYRTGAARV